MDDTLKLVGNWLTQYGYFATVPALLFDATGVPWPWVVLMLLSDEAGLNTFTMLALGFAVLSLWDHGLYWLGLTGGRRALHSLEARFAWMQGTASRAASAVAQQPFVSVGFGKFLPVVGRFVGLGAGLCEMNYLKFCLYDALSVGITVLGFGWAAHLLGRQILDDPRLDVILRL